MIKNINLCFFMQFFLFLNMRMKKIDYIAAIVSAVD